MKTPSAHIVSIGNELLQGRIRDTNAAYIAKLLASVGIIAKRFSTVGDGLRDIAGVIKDAVDEYDCVVATGGIGPTQDDHTREAAALAIGRKLVFHQPSMKHITSVFGRMGRSPLDDEKRQAFHPSGATVIPNPAGIAPGFLARNGKKALVVLPGVPGEIKAMLGPAVRELKKIFPHGTQYTLRLIHTIGMTESRAAKAVADVPGAAGTDWGITANDLVITVSLSAPSRTKKELDSLVRKIKRRLGRYVFGTGETTLAAAVVKLLKRRSLTLATAESCTGGLIASLVTSVPGASDVFGEGFVTYSNAAKERLLGVSRRTLTRHGAASQETALEMAEGALHAANADVAVATTGIAGPTGGSREKPVGLVYLAAATKQNVVVKKRMFPGSRGTVQRRAANTALNMARLIIEET